MAHHMSRQVAICTLLKCEINVYRLGLCSALALKGHVVTSRRLGRMAKIKGNYSKV